jgi:uncharacterized protein YgiM (DUF1202 family)
MRMQAIVVFLGIAICGTAAADADTRVVASKELRLRARPGETAAVVARADRGEKLTVVDEWGRWLRVRHGKRVGWVTRTQVESTAAAAPRKRPQRGGFSGKPVADALHVTIEADEVRGFDDPRTKATCVMELSRGDAVTVIGKGHDGWMLVEAEGVVGWIPDVATQPAAAYGRTWQVAARAGYHYATLAVESERAEPMLLGESTAGVTVGVGGALPIGEKLHVSATVDVMPAGVQVPAELPPGVLYATATQAAWARATVAYRLPAHLVAAVSYRGGMARTELTDGASIPTLADRTDQSHALTAGLGLRW